MKSTITVKEYIEILSKFNPDLPVISFMCRHNEYDGQPVPVPAVKPTVWREGYDDFEEHETWTSDDDDDDEEYSEVFQALWI